MRAGGTEDNGICGREIFCVNICDFHFLLEELKADALVHICGCRSIGLNFSNSFKCKKRDAKVVAAASAELIRRLAAQSFLIC